MDNGESSYRRFLAGDESAFDQILTEYRPSLTFFLQRIVGNPDVAEDLAIDTFVQLLLHPKRYDFRCSLKTYLFTIGRSRALDYLRRHRRMAAEPLPDSLPGGADPEELVWVGCRSKALHAALDQLPNDMRTALHLVYFGALSYQETALVMHKSPKQVDNLLYRGKAKLRIILEKEGITFL